MGRGICCNGGRVRGGRIKGDNVGGGGGIIKPLGISTREQVQGN